jgi:hypothetical protein
MRVRRPDYSATALSGADNLTIFIARRNDGLGAVQGLVPFRLTTDNGLSGSGNAAIGNARSVTGMQVDLNTDDYNRTHVFTIRLDPRNVSHPATGGQRVGLGYSVGRAGLEPATEGFWAVRLDQAACEVERLEDVPSGLVRRGWLLYFAAVQQIVGCFRVRERSWPFD